MILVCVDVCVMDIFISSLVKVNIIFIVYRRVVVKLFCWNFKKLDVIIVIDDIGYMFI